MIWYESLRRKTKWHLKNLMQIIIMHRVSEGTSLCVCVAEIHKSFDTQKLPHPLDDMSTIAEGKAESSILYTP